MTRIIFALLALLAASPALAGAPGVTLTGDDNRTVGTAANPLVTAPAPGGSAAPVSSPDAALSGMIAAGTAGSAFTVPVNDRGTVRFNIVGLSNTGATLQAQYTVDGTVWEAIAILRPPLAYGTTVTADGQYEVKASGASAVRLVVTAAGSAGTVTVSALATQLQGLVGIVGALPPGSAILGRVGFDQTTPGATNGVVVNSSALPTGAAQEAGGNLATIAARTPALGQATKAASQPVVIASDQGPLTVTPNACTITQTVVSLPAGASTQLVGVNPNRKSLRWMDVGANPLTVSYGTAAAVANQGINYAAGSGAQPSGGSESFFGDGIPTGAFQGISTSGTTAVIWECQ